MKLHLWIFTYLLVLWGVFLPWISADSSTKKNSPTDSLISNSLQVSHKASPAVVGINCVVMAKSNGQVYEQHYFGTGVVVSSDGLVLTNITVVPQAGIITLFLSSGELVGARYLASSQKTETTLLKANLREDQTLPYLKLGDSRQLQLGSCVYSLGNPYHSIEEDALVAISRGIISGLYEITDNGERESHYQGPVIESTAALNPGSDGGPLVDSQGRLLGVLSLAFQIERRMGAAIPIHLIVAEFPELQSLKLETSPFQVVTPAQVIAQQARNYAKSVVSLDISRTPEPDHIARPEKKIFLNKKEEQKWRAYLSQRPPGYVTGVVIEEGNYILTSAYHVSHSEEQHLQEGHPKHIKQILVHHPSFTQPIPAKVVARNTYYDIALLQPQRPLPLAAASLKAIAPPIGTWTGVIGRQRGSDQLTLTTGIISATERRHNLVKVYQTQALINYANSGGPVIDEQGNLLGIANFLHPQAEWGVNSGVAIFVGSETLLEILPKLKQGKSSSHAALPFLGVGQWLSPHHHQRGAPIATVNMDSGAAQAGVQPGDILTAIDGKPVEEWSDVVRWITSKEIGESIHLQILRQGKTLNLEAQLGKRPSY